MRIVGRDSAVGLDCPGMDSRYGRDFPHPVLIDPGIHPATLTGVPGLFWG
jgi:hypothetical protein